MSRWLGVCYYDRKNNCLCKFVCICVWSQLSGTSLRFISCFETVYRTAAIAPNDSYHCTITIDILINENDCV